MWAGLRRCLSPSRLTARFGGAKIYLPKREARSHRRAAGWTTCLGQDACWPERMGKTTHHGRDRRRPCTASPPRRCARSFGLPMRGVHGRGSTSRGSSRTCCACRLLGAEGPAGRQFGAATLKDAMNEALRDWVAKRRRTRSTASAPSLGPHPSPDDGAQDFQSIIGARPARKFRAPKAGLPDALVALRRRRLERHGPIPPFLPRRGSVKVYGVEAPADGIDVAEHAAAITERQSRRAPRQPHVSSCRTTTARSQKRHSISAGLDYPGVGPEHACLNDLGRVEFLSAPPTTKRSRHSSFAAKTRRHRSPALEPAHALRSARRCSTARRNLVS